jgi:hypothetical protein
MFQYKFNDTNFTQYNKVLVALLVWSNFALECACALFLEKEVVLISSSTECIFEHIHLMLTTISTAPELTRGYLGTHPCLRAYARLTEN